LFDFAASISKSIPSTLYQRQATLSIRTINDTIAGLQAQR
jgi:hypothetical protein